MLDLIKEAPLGQAVRFISRNQMLLYPEERSDFQLPIQYAIQLGHREKSDPTLRMCSHINAQTNTMATNEDPSGTGTGYSEDVEEVLETLAMVRSSVSVRTAPYINEHLRAEQELDLQRTKSVAIIPQKTSGGIVLVHWYTTDDSANPHNWSSEKKGFVVFIICCYT